MFMAQYRLLTFRQLKELKGVAFSRQHISGLIRRGLFPRSVKTPGGGQINFWVESEIDEYIEGMMHARDTTPPDEEARAQRAARLLAARKNRTVVIQRRQRA
jgi:predicted DNA-binding transcriptional regulator AlpA